MQNLVTVIITGGGLQSTALLFLGGQLIWKRRKLDAWTPFLVIKQQKGEKRKT